MMTEDQMFAVWLAVFVTLLATVVIPVMFYLCARMAAIGKLSGERWFWIRHAEEADELEQILARKEREEDEQ